MSQKIYIGAVNTYNSSPLAGCINDGRGMLDLFEKNGWDVGLARVQYNDAMTNDRIRNAWDWVTAGDEKYRLIVESGHGSHRPRTPTAAMPDPTEEFLCPYDIDFKWGAPDLVTDYYIEKSLEKLPDGCKALVFGFCCESGGRTQTTVDDAAAAVIKNPSAKVKYLRNPWEHMEAVKRQPGVPKAFIRAEENVFEDESINYVYFAAARSDQFSYEVSEVLELQGPNDTRIPSSFDVSRKMLCDVLTENPGLSIRKAHKEVVNRIREAYNFPQTPQLWGPKRLLDSDFFS